MILDDSWVLGWLALALASTAYVFWDNFIRGNPETTVMRWGWVLVTLYMGPVGATSRSTAEETGDAGRSQRVRSRRCVTG